MKVGQHYIKPFSLIKGESFEAIVQDSDHSPSSASSIHWYHSFQWLSYWNIFFGKINKFSLYTACHYTELVHLFQCHWAISDWVNGAD